MKTDRQMSKWIKKALIREAVDYSDFGSKLDVNAKKANAEAVQFFNKIAKDNGLEYVVFRDGDDIEAYGTFEALLKGFPDEATKKFVAKRWEEAVNDDPEKYGVEYHDDSDYDPEYGYGPYGEYDQDQIDEIAGEQAEEELEALTWDVLNTKALADAKEKFLADKVEGKDKIVKWFEENPLVQSSDESGYIMYDIGLAEKTGPKKVGEKEGDEEKKDDEKKKKEVAEAVVPKRYYVFTGCNLAEGKISTQIREDIEFVYDVIKYYSEKLLTERYKKPEDLDWECQTRRNHQGAVFINDSKYCWSVFLVDK